MLERPILEIAPKTWLISEYRLVNLFLVAGRKRAVLIDTGAGIGPLREDVAALTDLPLDVLITHGDPDHVGGAGLFDQVYLHPADWEYSRRLPLTNEMRAWFAKSRGPIRNPGHVEEIVSLVPAQELPAPAYLPLAEGMVFDLGGRSLEVLHTPGHTPGSVSLLDKENRLLFTGDMVNVSMALAGHDFTQYTASLRKMWAREREFDFICIGHEIPAMRDKKAIAQYISITERLTSGQVTAKAEPDPIRIGKVYREGDLEIWCDCEA